ncbi:MAG: DUF167 domain-containing protein [Chitinispirillaceae bacterium]|nr:DUF167 domain-containing protein [Chitinispirillaceae bacterium]
MSSRCTFAVRIRPRAKRDAINIAADGTTVLVSVTAPPVDNKANGQCIRLLAKKTGCPRSSFSIIKGEHCRDKVIACERLTVEEVFERLTTTSPGVAKGIDG